MSKIIIGIHGLGNKPPFAVMEQWWLQSILDGFQAVHYPSSWLKFELVYWANFIHNKPLDPTEADTTSPLYLEDPYSQTGIIQRGQREPLQKKIKDYLEKQLDKLLLNEDLTINFSKVSTIARLYKMRVFCTINGRIYMTLLPHNNKNKNKKVSKK